VSRVLSEIAVFSVHNQLKSHTCYILFTRLSAVNLLNRYFPVTCKFITNVINSMHVPGLDLNKLQNQEWLYMVTFILIEENLPSVWTMQRGRCHVYISFKVRTTEWYCPLRT